jgi:hypothetical protein
MEGKVGLAPAYFQSEQRWMPRPTHTTTDDGMSSRVRARGSRVAFAIAPNARIL